MNTLLREKQTVLNQRDFKFESVGSSGAWHCRMASKASMVTRWGFPDGGELGK